MHDKLGMHGQKNLAYVVEYNMILDYLINSKETNHVCIWTPIIKNKHAYGHCDWENKQIYN